MEVAAGFGRARVQGCAVEEGALPPDRRGELIPRRSERPRRVDDSTVVEELRRRGHDVTVGDAWSEGRLCAVARDPETGVLSAAANPRGMQGYAVGR